MTLASLLVLGLTITSLAMIRPGTSKPTAPAVSEKTVNTSVFTTPPQATSNEPKETPPAPDIRSLTLTPIQPVRSDATGEQSLAEGQATLTDNPDGATIDLTIQNLPGVVGFRYPAKIRAGRCSANWPDPPVQETLKPVEIGADGTARSSTTLSDKTPKDLVQGNSSLSVEVAHADWFTSTRIACADIAS